MNRVYVLSFYLEDVRHNYHSADFGTLGLFLIFFL